MSEAGAQSVCAWREGPVQIVRIDRPQRRNAVDARTAGLLGEAWTAFERDGEVRVGILTGGDEVFSAGAQAFREGKR